MLEFLGLIAIIFVVGVVALVGWILLLPFYLLFRLLGLAVKVSVGGLVLGLLAILLLPLLIVVGVAFFLPFLILAIPILLAIAFFGWLIGFMRPAAA